MAQQPYAKYLKLNELSYNCITYLINNNELIWRLLYYNDPDAWKKADLTQAQKASMIYSGQEDTTKYRVFMDNGQPDAWAIEAAQIRVYPYDIYPENPYIGTLAVMFEVYSHYKINHLSNYTTRVDTITQQLLETFNGVTSIGGLGAIYFDRSQSLESRMYMSGQIPYKGKAILFGSKFG